MSDSKNKNAKIFMRVYILMLNFLPPPPQRAFCTLELNVDIFGWPLNWQYCSFQKVLIHLQFEWCVVSWIIPPAQLALLTRHHRTSSWVISLWGITDSPTPHDNTAAQGICSWHEGMMRMKVFLSKRHFIYKISKQITYKASGFIKIFSHLTWYIFAIA